MSGAPRKGQHRPPFPAPPARRPGLLGPVGGRGPGQAVRGGLGEQRAGAVGGQVGGDSGGGQHRVHILWSARTSMPRPSSATAPPTSVATTERPRKPAPWPPPAVVRGN